MRWRAALLCGLSLLGSEWYLPCQARPFDASDLVNRERIGAVVAAPRGNLLVYERESAYASAGDFTLAAAGAPWGRSDLYVVNTSATKPTPRRLLPNSDARRLALGDGFTSGSFSPDGKKVTVFWPDGPHIHLGYYDFDLNRLIEISDAPVVHSDRVPPVWLSATRLMYMVAVSNTESWEAERYRIAKTLEERWDIARAGRSTARVFDSGAASNGSLKAYGGKLVIFDTVKKTQQVVGDGRFSTVAISPNGSWIAALHLIGPAAQAPGGRSEFEFDRGEIELFGLDGKQFGLASCASCDVLHDSIAWSADSGKLAYFARPIGGTASQGHYWTFDIRLKKHLSVDTPGVKLERVNFVIPAARAYPVSYGIVYEGVGHCGASSDSARYLYYQSMQSAPRCISPLPIAPNAVLRVSRDSVDVFASGQVWRLFVESKKSTRLFQRDMQQPSVSTQFGVMTAGISSGPVRSLEDFAAIDLKDEDTVLSMNLLVKTQESTQSPGKRAQLLGGSPASGSFLYRLERAGVSHIVLARPTAPPIEILVLNESYATIDLPIEQPLAHSTSSGMSLISCITTPRGSPPAHGFPTIVSLYPNHSPKCEPGEKPIDLDMVEASNVSSGGEYSFMKSMASHGLAILTVATPFSALPNKHGLEGLDDLVERALQAGAQRGLVDLSRVGLEGHSQGGWAGVWMLTHTKRFSAAVLSAGISDNISSFGALSAGVRALALDRDARIGFGNPYAYTRADSNAYLGGAPWEVPGAYLQDNQIVRSNHISTPLMLFNGDMDGIGIGQFEELYSALEMQGSEVKLVTYLGEGHVYSSPANIMDAWTRQVEWFSSHLRITPSPLGN